jgi:glutamine amidotransferase
MIAIINYGMGNLRSVSNALNAVGAAARVAVRPEELAAADRIVLPGVGAFGVAMDNLRVRGWVEALHREVIERGKPFLGICLGLQLLASRGTEHGVHAGLDWVPGQVTRLPGGGDDVRVPHIGWNDVRFLRPGTGLSEGLDETETFYFVHSYAFHPDHPAAAKGLCDHGVTFAACVEKDNLWATQFHPEKSQRPGLQILRNFARWKV